MYTLFIDTHDSSVVLVLYKNQKLELIKEVENSRAHSEITIPLIVKLLEEENISIHKLSDIIVVNGPGSFTGVRIGITISKVYAWSSNIPITTITSLEAMALSSNNNKVHVPIINARRGYVYGAIYDGDRTVLMEQYITLEKLKLILIGQKKDYVFISNDKFDDFGCQEYDPDILKIINTFSDRGGTDPHFVNPVYLKLTEAEENKNKDN